MPRTPPPDKYDWIDLCCLVLITGGCWFIASSLYQEAHRHLHEPLTLAILQAYVGALLFGVAPFAFHVEHDRHYLIRLVHWLGQNH